MIDILNKLKSVFRVNDAKSRTVAKNVLISFLAKGINVSVSFLTVPLVLTFLDTTKYGIWLTLTAILNWFTLFDLGFGNGLRNKLTTSITMKNVSDGKIYVSTTYAALTTIFGSVLILFLCINPFISWYKVFNAPIAMKDDLRLAVTFTATLLLIQLILRVINAVLLAHQRSAMANITNSAVQVAILVGLYAVKLSGFTSLISVSIVYSIMPVLVFLIVSFFLFSKTYRYISPSVFFVRKKYVRSLMSVGLNFFVLQVAVLVLYASDNFIIAQFFSPKDVTTYNIGYKYFSIVNIMLTIILAPVWSMTTKAYTEKDYAWIRSSMKKLFFTWSLLVLTLLLQLVIAKPMYKIWTGNNVSVPLTLSIVLCIYFVVYTWGSIFANFLNGVNKVKMQLYLAVASMILNIPLAIFFIKTLHLGMIGIPMATIVIQSVVSIVAYIQYKKIITETAVGVWNQ